MKIIHMRPDHWKAVKEIYEEGISSGKATFSKEAPSFDEWDAGHLNIARLVAVENQRVMGWIALSPLSTMPAYSGYVESSIYVSKSAQGKGIGKELLKVAIKESEANHIWTLEAKIIEENEASIALHKKVGFKVVGIREKIGKLNGEWKNTVILERRSKIVGIK